MQNLVAAGDLLRAVHRFRICTAKLAEAGLFPAVGPSDATTPDNLPAAAAALRELEELTGSQGPQGLEKVDGVAKDIIAVRKASTETRKRATAILKAGLASRTQTDVEAAVSAFSSLNILDDRINAELARLLRETQSSMHRALDAPHGAVVPARGRGLRGIPSIGSVAASPGGVDVWANIDRMLEVVAQACFKAILLQQVLSRKYCDVSHMSLLHDTVASNFIDALSRTMAEQIGMLARTRKRRPAAGYVFLALAEGFPRLKSSLVNLSDRVSALARVSPTPITKIVNASKLPLIPNHEFIQNAFFSAVVEVETHYLTASLERLTASVSSFFEGTKYAGETEALTLTKALAAELTAARGDKQLLRTAVNNVATALRLYTSHAEDYAAATAIDDDGRALGEVEEWRLTGLYNGMVTLAVSASRILGERDDGSGPIPEPISKELGTLKHLCDLLLDGPFSTCRSNIRKVLLRMHTEDLTGEVGDDGCSVYVLDISSQISMFADGIIPGLTRSRSLGKFTLDLAKWVLDAFAQSVALVFPQTELVRLRLSTDMARIELAVESLCAARLLGKSYQCIRALRTTMMLKTEALHQNDEELFDQLNALRPSTLAHLLLARSSEGGLKQPHRRQDISPSEYASWLESHTEEEAWEQVELSLEEYRTTELKPGSAPCPEYKAVTSLCKKLRESEN
ncbi:unnamed protein product [Chondrus crispus]|uniref:Conserved oligomeric Golgi complex subunit 5 helical domain-containing protein n=1 Tax=Chondrus crispus TaxID=2769 RepID=R7QMG4_CHOCR|nr:unnamed protein product [Chondrus crispus]CDF39702.1 unnamed protein product [Chondrus crispus]|eukprot:XP_005709996.1 unnamed protein product [Chondrus crispus]